MSFFIQAQRRWVEQQDEFVRRRRDHEMRMIAMEATEADRREEEIRRRIEGLDEQKRKNRSANQAGSEEVSNLSGLNVNTGLPAYSDSVGTTWVKLAPILVAAGTSCSAFTPYSPG